MDKILVLAGSFVSIGLIVWWFFGKWKSEAIGATVVDGKQRVVITVDGGYSPGIVMLEKGIPAELEFFRKDASGCLEQVVFPDLGISERLPVGVPHIVRFTPDKSGELDYACGMNMFFGKVIVK